jgi:heme-degrading monooxygenase HmoA
MPAYVMHKRFVADGGERCTIVEFADEASHRAWANNPDHAKAMERGKQFFASYNIKVCEMKYRLSKP